MRVRHTLAACAAAVALTVASGCGSDQEGRSSADGDGLSAGSGGRLMDGGTEGRPSAATMADVEAFVSRYTTCTDLHMQDEDYEDAVLPNPEEAGIAWGIEERAVCFNLKRNSVRLMTITDMKSFQTRAKEHGGGYLLGEDFAVASGTSATRNDLEDSGLLDLHCDPDTPIPSGYRKEKALVDGCTLTDFVS